MQWRALSLGLALLVATLPAFARAADPADLEPAPTSDPVPASRTLPFDTDHSAVGFRLSTRWGQRLRGEFPGYDGEVVFHPDGRREVRVRLDSTRMQILGRRRYTRWARGPEFFDVAQFPTIEFRSETYDEALLRDGGPLHGTLTMRGVSRPVRFMVEPATCDAPGRDCDVVAHGEVDRTQFGMEAWQVAVGETVRFSLRVRTRGDAQ